MATTSTPTPISPLRQRMQHDMMMRGLLPRTQDQYIRHVRRFAAFLGRPPDTATLEDLRNFQIRQHEGGASAGTINGAVSALRFLYTVTLRRRDLARGLIATRRPDKMREVLSVEEATRLLEAAPGIKYKAALGVAYGAGLRVSEVAHLKVDDIDSERMLTCRTAAQGGHVEACEDCGHWRIAYNSCRNRHCPKCQGAAARTWLAEREADLLPVGYFHVVFTLPAEIAAIAFQNKAVVYDLLFRAASETMLTIAADPRHLGARIGITAVLHTWGSAMTHHPHVHMIVPGGGIASDGTRWIASRPAFLLPVRVLGKLFRRLFLTRLAQLHDAGRLGFFGSLAHLAERSAFQRHLAPVRKKAWVVYAKAPFAGPEAVLAYLSRYTHRVAIANRRLLAFDETSVTFRFKDYRRNEPERQRIMTLATDEFIRRFLLHVLSRGFHRIRHYGLLAGSARKACLAEARRLLHVATPPDDETEDIADPRPPCPCCGGHMLVIDAIPRRYQPRAPPVTPPPIREPAS